MIIVVVIIIVVVVIVFIIVIVCWRVNEKRKAVKRENEMKERGRKRRRI